MSTADGQHFDIGEGFAVGRTLDGDGGSASTANHLHTDGDCTRLAVGLHLDVVASIVKLDEIRSIGCTIIATQTKSSYAIQSQEVGFWSTFPFKRQHSVVNHRSGLGDGYEVGIDQIVLCIMGIQFEISCAGFVAFVDSGINRQIKTRVTLSNRAKTTPSMLYFMTFGIIVLNVESLNAASAYNYNVLVSDCRQDFSHV